MVNSLHMSLLGQGALEKLGLISFDLDSIQSSAGVREKFPMLTCPLWDLVDPYDTALHDGIIPYAFKVPRYLVVPQLLKVKAELQRMVEIGVIRPITESTDWCALLVVVPI